MVSTNQRELSRPRPHPQDLKSVLRIQADFAWIKTRIFLTNDPRYNTIMLNHIFEGMGLSYPECYIPRHFANRGVVVGFNSN